MTIKDIINHLELLAPLDYSEEFDNVGLLTGNYTDEVNGVLVTLDTLEQTVDEAIEKNCNLIVSFHPIIFKGLKSITGKNYVERVIIKAIQNNIAIYSMHTALDNSIHGVSAKMCEVIGLLNTKVLIPQKGNIKKLTTYVPNSKLEHVRNALFEAGAGHIGNYENCSFNAEGIGTYKGNSNSNPVYGEKGVLHKESETLLTIVFEKHLEARILKVLIETHPYEEVAYDVITLDNVHQNIGMGMFGELESPMEEKDFLELLKDQFHLKNIRHSSFRSKKIKKVAVLGGSGSFAIESAIRNGADIFITADLKYHDFYRAENQLVLADIGHYESEQFTKDLLVDYLTKKFTNFAIILSKTNTNPINYF